MNGVRAALRHTSTGWAVVAVLVALLALTVRAAGLAVGGALLLAERFIAVLVVVAVWADEQTSDRAGLARPLAAGVTESRLGR